MEDISPLNRLLENGKFRFERLLFKDIDNLPVIKINAPDIVDQKTCLFHRDVSTGDDYLRVLHHAIREAMPSDIDALRILASSGMLVP